MELPLKNYFLKRLRCRFADFCDEKTVSISGAEAAVGEETYTHTHINI